MPSKRALLSALLLALTWAMLLPSPSLAQRACIKGETGSPEFWYFEVLQLCHNCQCYVRICSAGPVASGGIATVMPHHCV